MSRFADPNPFPPRRVAVAMSGGVDSSVAALLLQRAGSDVVGVTFRLFGCDLTRDGNHRPASCCSRADAADAAAVARQLAIPHDIIDLSGPFRTEVIAPFVQAYRQGLTPNPCILCNQRIKFGAFVQWARARGFDAVATGHYARISREESRYRLLQGRDRAKDQSYFLFPLTQETMASLTLPVGGLAKNEVRQLARDSGLPVARKAESQDLCFVSSGSYARFVEEEGAEPIPAGEIVHLDGRLLGQHQGLHRYTIGQRQGLGLSSPEPLYVVAREKRHNRLVVGPRSALEVTMVVAADCCWTGGRIPAVGSRLTARCRYRGGATAAVVAAADGKRVEVRLEEPVLGVAPGQALVLYDGEEVVGGGWMEAVSSEGEDGRKSPPR